MLRHGPQTSERGPCPAIRRFARRAPFGALLAFFCLAGPAAASVAVQGDAIVNVASVDAQGVSSGGPIPSNSTTVSVRIPTPAFLDLMEYAPRAANATQESTVQGAYRNGPSPTAALVLLPLPRPTGSSTPLDLTRPLPVLATSYYHQRDPVFIRVTDGAQNLDRTARDTVR